MKRVNGPQQALALMDAARACQQITNMGGDRGSAETCTHACIHLLLRPLEHTPGRAFFVGPEYVAPNARQGNSLVVCAMIQYQIYSSYQTLALSITIKHNCQLPAVQCRRKCKYFTRLLALVIVLVADRWRSRRASTRLMHRHQHAPALIYYAIKRRL